MNTLTTVVSLSRTVSEEVDDPCLPANIRETLTLGDKTLALRGMGNFESCRTALRPVLHGNASVECSDRTCKVTHSFAKPPVKYTNMEFFGTSEFFYTMRDTLRIAGRYSANDFSKRAQVYIYIYTASHTNFILLFLHSLHRTTVRQTGVYLRRDSGRTSILMLINTASGTTPPHSLLPHFSSSPHPRLLTLVTSPSSPPPHLLPLVSAGLSVPSRRGCHSFSMKGWDFRCRLLDSPPLLRSVNTMSTGPSELYFTSPDTSHSGIYNTPLQVPCNTLSLSLTWFTERSSNRHCSRVSHR